MGRKGRLLQPIPTLPGFSPSGLLWALPGVLLEACQLLPAAQGWLGSHQSFAPLALCRFS